MGALSEIFRSRMCVEHSMILYSVFQKSKFECDGIFVGIFTVEIFMVNFNQSFEASFVVGS